jgi:CrcB protein
MISTVIQTYGVVMLGGALGTGVRLWLSSYLAARFGETFPVGTLAVNILGCLVIGLYVGLTGPQGILIASPLARQFVAIGVLGGFTTFSSFGLQTFNLVGDGEWLRAGLNVILSVGACLGAVWIGVAMANAINQGRL